MAQDEPFYIGEIMYILIRTDLGTQRIVGVEDISYVDALNTNSVTLELKSKPGFDIRVGMGIESFLKVLNGEEKFEDLYIDQGYQKTIENSSEELENLKFDEETEESKKAVEEFKKELTPRRNLSTPPTFSKKKQNDAAKVIIDKTEEVVDSATSAW